MKLFCVALLSCAVGFSHGFLLDTIFNVGGSLTGGGHASGEVCYNGLGCFSNSPPFHTGDRDMTYLPQYPSHIGTRFLLFTRETENAPLPERLNVTDRAGAQASHFSSERLTKFIVHGFSHNGQKQWVKDLTRELLLFDDMNVIVVDWEIGAALPYGQAAANTRVVGAQIAQLITFLHDTFGNDNHNVHIIGHSIGAHVAGYAGERTARLGRISGLDPAGPFFQQTDPHVRLDPSDAEFVDVVHTDGSSFSELGMGAPQEMGHVDFYPNGGRNQPGCDPDVFSKLTHAVWNAVSIGYYAAEGAVSCNHMRSVELYTESINAHSCPFAAFPCTGMAEFDLGHCLQCTGHGCSRLGYHADTEPGRGSLFLRTQNSRSFCNYHYQVNLTSENNVDGQMTVVLFGDQGQTAHVLLSHGDQILNSGTVLSQLLTTRTDLGNVTAISVRYDKTHSLLVNALYSDIWTLRSAVAWSGEHLKRYVFCAGQENVPDQSPSVFQLSGHCS